MNDRAVAGKTPAILRNYHITVLTFLLVSFLAVVAPTVIPNQNDDDKALEDWMVAVIASVAGVVLIVILVFLIYWFTIRNKADGGKEIHKKLLISAFKQQACRSLSFSRSVCRFNRKSQNDHKYTSTMSSPRNFVQFLLVLIDHVTR